MKVLVIGAGAREHALSWRIAASPRVSKVFCAPGNPGIAQVAELLPIAPTATKELLQAVIDNGIDLTVVGPEVALEAGVVDLFEANGKVIVGPTKAAALLESSKAFAKEIMLEAGVPTASHHVFSECRALERHCAEVGAPLVLKADGLAAGKGVFVIERAADFPAAIEALFGTLRAERVVVEEFLSGVEVSCIFASNGSLFRSPLPTTISVSVITILALTPVEWVRSAPHPVSMSRSSPGFRSIAQILS